MEAIKQAIELANSALPILGFIVATVASFWTYVHRNSRASNSVEKKDEAKPISNVLQGTPVPAQHDQQFELRTLELMQERIDELEEERDAAYDERDAAYEELDRHKIARPKIYRQRKR